MHNKTYNKQNNQEQPVRHLHEGLQYRDLDGLMKPTVHVDEFSSKMGEDADVKRKKLAILKYGNTEIRVANSSKDIQETKTMILTQASS